MKSFQMLRLYCVGGPHIRPVLSNCNLDTGRRVLGERGAAVVPNRDGGLRYINTQFTVLPQLVLLQVWPALRYLVIDWI